MELKRELWLFPDDASRDVAFILKEKEDDGIKYGRILSTYERVISQRAKEFPAGSVLMLQVNGQNIGAFKTSNNGDVLFTTEKE